MPPRPISAATSPACPTIARRRTAPPSTPMPGSPGLADSPARRCPCAASTSRSAARRPGGNDVMTRLLGFLSGLLLVAALAVAAVRYPPAEPFRDQGGRVDEPGRDGESRESGHGKPADDRVPEAAPAPGPGAPEPASAAATEERGDAVAADAPPEPPAPVPPPAAAPGAQIDHAERQWYAFWQPFRSEISAKGFRRRLEGVTGLDYR